MKKFAVALAAFIMAFGSVIGVQAAQTKLTVSGTYLPSTSRAVDIVLENDTEDKASTSIKGVLGSIDELKVKGASATQSFSVTSTVEEDGAVDVYLRMAVESNSTTAQADAAKLIGLYDITIKQDDNLVYVTDPQKLNIESPEKGLYVTDMYLGRFNENDLSETRSYALTAKISNSATVSQIKNAKNIKWEIVSDPVQEGEEAPAMQIPEATAAPTTAPTAVPAKPAGSSAVSAAPIATAAPTAAPQATTPVQSAAPTEAEEEKASPLPQSLDTKTEVKEKTVGTGKDQIAPGTYTVTAKDKDTLVKVYNKDGSLKREIEINSAKPSQVVTLTEGQKITYTNPTNLTPYKSGTVSTASAGSKSDSNAKSDTTASSSKKNPKTGDTTPVAGAAALGVFALGMLAYPELEKRRNRK